MAKLRVGLLFGGRSVEHEVSLVSAASILRALDPTRYDVGLIGVDHNGRWHLAPPTLPEEVIGSGEEVTLPAFPGGRKLVSSRQTLCEQSLSAELRGALEQLDLVAALGRHGRRLHTGRSATGDPNSTWSLRPLFE